MVDTVSCCHFSAGLGAVPPRLNPTFCLLYTGTPAAEHVDGGLTSTYDQSSQEAP